MSGTRDVTVADIMSRDVLAVSPGDSIHHAGRAMSRRRVGSAAVVDERGALVGILTERDVLRAVAHHDDLAGATQAVMSQVVATVTPDTLVAEAMGEMSSRSIRHLPVVSESGGLEGIVSMRDLVRAVVCPDVPDRARVGLAGASSSI